MPSSAISPTLQNAMYVAINLQDILYGVELVLYLETIHVVLTRRKRERSEVFLAIFSTVMLILITIWVSTSALFGEQMWVVHTDYPGGSASYWVANVASWYLDMGRAACFALQLMTDGLLIHRCWAIWTNATVIIVPSILWVATLVLGVIQTWIYSSHVGNFLHSTPSYMALAYYTTCVALNTTLTSMICYRLVRHGKLVRAELGHKYSLGYIAIAAIIVESALPFTISGLAFLVTLGMSSKVMIPFSWVYFMMTCISPQMLIRRVLSRNAFGQSTGESASPLSNINFQAFPDLCGVDKSEGASSKVDSDGDKAGATDRTSVFT